MEVEAVYAVSREGENERLEETRLDNHKLLWHGSRTSNLISIFHKGLLIAPDEAASHAGAAFGKVRPCLHVTLFSAECIKWWEMKQFIHICTVSNQFVQCTIQNVSQFTLLFNLPFNPLR